MKILILWHVANECTLRYYELKRVVYGITNMMLTESLDEAGNGIQMPGYQKNMDDIVEAVETGKEVGDYQITLADFEYNAANVIRVVEKTMK